MWCWVEAQGLMLKAWHTKRNIAHVCLHLVHRTASPSQVAKLLHAAIIQSSRACSLSPLFVLQCDPSVAPAACAAEEAGPSVPHTLPRRGGAQGVRPAAPGAILVSDSSSSSVCRCCGQVQPQAQPRRRQADATVCFTCTLLPVCVCCKQATFVVRVHNLMWHRVSHAGRQRSSAQLLL